MEGDYAVVASPRGCGFVGKNNVEGWRF